MHRSADSFQVGKSSISWDGSKFTILFDELECPIPRRLRGRITIHPSAFSRFETALDAEGLHRWGPIAPCSLVEADLMDGALRWKGAGYFDSNSGDEPIERPFRLWDWSRSVLVDGSTSVIYDVQPRMGPDRLVARVFRPDGSDEEFDAPARIALPRTAWGIRRSIRGEVAEPVSVLETFEDTPFYVRDVVRSTHLGQSLVSVHETLDTNRLASWPVRMMLPFRMPRRA